MECGMSSQSRQEIAEQLSVLLADTYAVYLKTQNFHWNVSGQEFFSLHLLFEKQYSELSEALDEIAERIRALGFYVDASFSAFKKQSSIPDEDGVPAAREMIQKLIHAHETIILHGRRLVQVAEKQKDAATVDLTGRRLVVHEKFAWMLRSQI